MVEFLKAPVPALYVNEYIAARIVSGISTFTRLSTSSFAILICFSSSASHSLCVYVLPGITSGPVIPAQTVHIPAISLYGLCFTPSISSSNGEVRARATPKAAAVTLCFILIIYL
ncbi:lysozyme [Escherichia phage PGN590]|uniref:Lysozyme n=1 Tax=Escherichia phage PGN590 TaxID=2714735 RepID=A0A6M9EL74_9CAUD|nr:lysozyme [Escherichia phage PGN590]QKL16943.1 lysozyme [Escherichia phage PGN590]